MAIKMSDWLTPKVKAKSYYWFLSFCQKTKPVNGQVYQDVLAFGVCPQTHDTELATGMPICFSARWGNATLTFQERALKWKICSSYAPIPK
jgi:hypothetical protein